MRSGNDQPKDGALSGDVTSNVQGSTLAAHAQGPGAQAHGAIHVHHHHGLGYADVRAIADERAALAVARFQGAAGHTLERVSMRAPKGATSVEALLEKAAIVAGQSGVTARDFFTSQPQADWVGVYCEWDSPRAFRQELLDLTLDSLPKSCKGVPVAAIIGPGGSGKSVALRRLAVDLCREGHQVWWVTSIAAFAHEGASELPEQPGQTQFVLLDNLEVCTRIDLQRLTKEIRSLKDIVWVVAGREIPRSTPWSRGDLRVFEPDEAGDRMAILENIARLIPEWSDIAKSLAAEQLRHARLVRVLLLLARTVQAPKSLDELEQRFLEILSDDVRRADEMVRGFAGAIVDAAILRELGINVDHKTLITLADLHQPGARLLLNQFSSRWDALLPLMSQVERGSTYRWRFHHNEIAGGIIRAGSAEHQMLGPDILVDDIWRRRLFYWVMNHGEDATSSSALYSIVSHHGDLVGDDFATKYLSELIEKKPDNDTYLALVLSPSLSLSAPERYELLKRVAFVARDNHVFWNAAMRWAEECCSVEQRRELALLLMDETNGGLAACPAHTAIVCLKLLERQEAKMWARRFLSEVVQHEVLRACLNILGSDAKEDARRLLRTSTDHDVLCACLKLLGTEALDDARRLVNESSDHEVLTTCIKLLGADAKEASRRVLWRDNVEPYLASLCLKTLGGDAIEEARRLLRHATHPGILCACLKILGPHAKDDARRLLREGRSGDLLGMCLKVLGAEAKEDARRLLKTTRHRAVLCVCLNLLGSEAREDARRLLVEPNIRVEVACRCVAILDEEAVGWARERLSCWRSAQPELISACLGVAWQTVEAQSVAMEILSDWHDVSPQLRTAALGMPSRLPLRLVRAREVLASWYAQRRILVAAALNAYGGDPLAVTQVCRTIVNRWRNEIDYQCSKGEDRHDIHIIKAMSHPMLRKEVGRVARDMLRAEAEEPGLLTEELRQHAERVLQGRYVPWAREQRASLRRPVA